MNQHVAGATLAGSTFCDLKLSVNEFVARPGNVTPMRISGTANDPPRHGEPRRSNPGSQANSRP
jgi:hypothetical protein